MRDSWGRYSSMDAILNDHAKSISHPVHVSDTPREAAFHPLSESPRPSTDYSQHDPPSLVESASTGSLDLSISGVAGDTPSCLESCNIRYAVIFEIVALCALIAVFVGCLFVHDVRPGWWVLSQITAWSLLAHVLYFLLAIRVDLGCRAATIRRFNLKLHRDRLFAILSALSAGVCVSFLCIVLPFTPRMAKISSDCSDSPDCVTGPEFAALLLSNVLPALFMLADSLSIRHKFAYRNLWVELGPLLALVIGFFLWSLVCWFINKDWPYSVQSSMADHVGYSVLAHILSVAAFIALYFLQRLAVSKYWEPRPEKTHYTDKLLASMERAWSQAQAPSSNEFEIHTFGPEPDAHASVAMGSLPSPDSALSVN